MKIISATPEINYKLKINLDDGRSGIFDVSPYLKYEAFESLADPEEFKKIHNGEYFLEWDNGADLSIDTIEAHLIY